MPKPEKRFQCGAVEASIFENETHQNGKPIKIKKIAFQKRYKSADRSWKSTNSLDINDLPKGILALQKAYEYLVLTPEQSEGNDLIENGLGDKEI